MNILLATYSYYPYNWGGTEVYISGLVSYLHQQGHQVTIIAGMPRQAFDDHPVFYEDDQIKTVTYQLNDVKILGVVLNNETIKEIYKKFRVQWVNSWLSILNKLSSSNWDILHLHAHTSPFGESLIKGIKQHSPGIKIIASYHLPLSCVKGTLLFGNTMKECEVKPSVSVCTACFISSKQNWPIHITKKIAGLMPLLASENLPTGIRIKFLVQQFINSFQSFDKALDLWHVFSEEIKGILQLNEVPEKKIFLLRHGVNPSFFEEEMNHKTLSRNATKIVFLYAARFENVKGFSTLLKAWCLLPELDERELWMVGEKQSGDEEIAGCILSASERKDILWMGSKNQEELALIMKKVHCVIIPSECVEIGPLVFHEAIAAGADVIASALGGCKELAGLYHKKTGLFEAGNSHQLAHKILNFRYSGQWQLPLSQTQNYQLVAESYDRLIAG